MELSALTHSELIFIDPPHRTPEAVIGEMSAALFRQGLINDKAMFIDSVLRRESEGPTALGESLAVPHGNAARLSRPHLASPCFASPSCGRVLRGTRRFSWYFCWRFPQKKQAVRICNY
ncbi:PTS system 2-O-a-mannosyl-D-glycerate specific transporter subunit IIABC [Citrobacter koseri]|uniref:PTS system 2-O-a-mannosyl-D-glycerate specific transporter subunit IIABC n=1 Tax=Citrobacter koseri TaxID=545 RepID=A0A447UQI9_CITKO|nr:PTS system 2-O-a-mannosyl-D-glycerate specific transporter subunit IIABC [Citrobacter koseri]